MIHVKEPSVFVHVPWGHVVGSAHSSISGKTTQTVRHSLQDRGVSTAKKKKEYIYILMKGKTQ